MEATLEAVTRDVRGKNAARRLRQSGMIPAVLYGTARGRSVGGDIPGRRPNTLGRILHSEAGLNSIIALKLSDGTTDRVLVKAYQLDPVTEHLLHADFYRFVADKLLVVTVPVYARGEPSGRQQEGGLLDFVHREIVVECLPADIPENIELDVTELMVGGNIRVRDVIEGQKWKAVTDLDTMLVHVVPPRVEEEPEEEAEAEVATDGQSEPEVMKKGKDEDGDQEK